MVLRATIPVLLLLLNPFAANAAGSGREAAFPVWTVAFFVLLILSIAALPLVCGEWWARFYPLVSLGLAVPAGAIVAIGDASLLLHTMLEYVSFIILLGSLFVISGGIVINTPARGSAKQNCLFLLAGAVFANIVGTTGASMVLIRPLIRANGWRSRAVHVYVFFIFVVSNIGGCLTPLGDPPLFLGYLKGVPFAWTLKLFPAWAFTVAILLALFYLVDRHFAGKEPPRPPAVQLQDVVQRRREIRGKVNLLLLVGVIISFFLPAILREAAMVAATLLSLYLTPVTLREENAFTYHPIIEVAILFAGIFVTMIPAMKILEAEGAHLGIDAPWEYFWMAGGLSSFLDNAPTYLVFVSAAKSVAVSQRITSGLIAGVPETFLRAISAGAVFMGANSYIGNGPNFMVKAICEENGVSMPSFFGYMGWSVAVLIPLFMVVTVIFFR